MTAEQPISLDEQMADSKPLVLVVDDDDNHQRLLELLADRLGITAYCVPSCQKALEALQKFSFDIVLMDYRMPEVDGCECARHIRAMKELRSGIPIIAVTAHVTPDSQQECFDAGMNDFLGKPFTFEELHKTLYLWIQKKYE